MACALETTQTALCTSGIGRVHDPILLLQIMAQLTSDLLLTVSASADITVGGINTRACTSGIGKIQDPIMLLQIIAQNTCELTP